MIATTATLNYDSVPAIVLPISDRQNLTASSYFSSPPTSGDATSQYGKFAPHFAKLSKIATEPSLLGEGDESPNVSALAWAFQFMQQFENMNCVPTKVVASANGGAAICFVAGNKYADIESLNSGAILGVISDKFNKPVVWEIEPNASGVAQAATRIRDFIYTP